MEFYNREEVLTSSLVYFRGDELAANVWINKYALKDSDGKIYELNPDDMHRRIASELARIEKQYINPLSEDEIYELIKDFEYVIPQGGPMSGIGNTLQTVSLSNCFVVGNEADSYGGITQTDQEQIQLMKRRGGVGHDLSHIRPKGSPVKNSALTSTGVVPFMERFSNSTREVAQDGRRGALMLSCFHGETFVLTNQGWMRIKQLVEKIRNLGNINSILCWTEDGYKDIIDTQIFEDREIFEVEVENGNKIKVTADHEFVVKNIVTGEEYLKALKDINVENEELVLYVD
jgi:ribonucleotide reductase alpha subunit